MSIVGENEGENNLVETSYDGDIVGPIVEECSDEYDDTGVICTFNDVAFSCSLALG
jgi:hypothetical protein